MAYHKWFSQSLGQDMELNVYGHYGQPIIAFPSSRGRFFDFENNGMIHSVQQFIDKGQIIIFAVDSRDQESWFSDKHPADKAKAYEAYVRYITNEVHPFITNWTHTNPIATGCSFGAYQSLNFFLRFPKMFKGCIALSGLYNLKQFVGDYYDDNIYFNEPETYIKNLTDQTIVNSINHGHLIMAVGQGPWEDDTGCLGSSKYMAQVLRDKNIKHWFDIWGFDVAHDWPWWRKMFPYFVGKVLEKL